MGKRVLINCSNLHTGGGVAVASSFIDCLSVESESRKFEIHLLISSEVDQNLLSLGTNKRRFASCTVKNFYGISALWKGLRRSLNGFDATFTVFGPSYTFGGVPRHLVGFAQPNIIYPNNPVFKQLRLWRKFSVRLKYLVQTLFFLRADALIVELPHVEKGLRRMRAFQQKKIHIVESSVHEIYSDPARWESLDFPRGPCKLNLGVISRNYPHKNLSVFPAVKKILSEEYGLDADFYVTFTPEEWADCSSEFRDSVINVGGLRLSQCPTFYSEMDGVVFPTLLECFSAVPIEAMKIKRPVFSSDLDFIRDVCANHAYYFDPLRPASIAKSIYEYFSLPLIERERFVDSANEYVKKYSSANVRARRYLNIIEDELCE